MDQHLGFAFGFQAVEHALNPRTLAAEHCLGQLEDVVAGHIEHGGLDLLEAEFTGRVQKA